MKKIIIFGKTGILGHELYRKMKNEKEFKIIGTSREEGYSFDNPNDINKFEELNIKNLEVVGFPNTYNPSAAFNLCAKNSNGRFFVLTNPECLHYNDVLGELDKHIDNLPDSYFVCSCENSSKNNMNISCLEEFEYNHHSWYQHSKYRNAGYHFCSIISRENYNKIGGFDERFMNGIAYDDDDFKEKIIFYDIPIIVLDELKTIHQHHSPEVYSAPDRRNRIEHNRNLYENNKKGRVK